jgi:type IV secretion system protein TrbI
MPNGRSIVLERQPDADTAGYVALEAEVDNHWGVALLSTLLGVGTELASTTGTGSNSPST